MKPAAQMAASVFALLLAIAPVPYQKWGLARIVFNLFAFVNLGLTSRRLDKDLEEQQEIDVAIFEQQQMQKQIAQAKHDILIAGEVEQESIRIGLQTQRKKAQYEGAFVTIMQHDHPEYLDAMEARHQALLNDQKRGYQVADRVGDLIETAAISSETGIQSEPKFLRSFVASTCLVWGNQGGGKSWFVRYLVRRKVDKGYRVIVFDPNSNQTAWEGLELVNTYEAIEEKMRWYIDEVMGRYADFTKSSFTEDDWRKNLWAKGQAISVICEEVTTYADFIEDTELVKKFIKVATTLSRKQEMPVTFVTHNNTQTCLGNIKGLGNLIAGMQQIELLPTTDPETDQPVASGRAKIKLDGSNQWVDVLVPKISSKITDFRQKVSQNGNTDSNLPTDIHQSENYSEPEDTSTRQDFQPSSDADVNTLREQFEDVYNCDFAEHIVDGMTQVELKNFIDTLQSKLQDNKINVSNTQIQDGVLDTSKSAYESPESLPGKVYPRIWTEEDFAKYLPDRDEFDLYNKMIEYFDTSMNASDIIKKANGWKFSSGKKYKWFGQPCFLYIIEKYGTPKQQEHFAGYISEYLSKASDEEESEQVGDN
jgi:hypothetical protein